MAQTWPRFIGSEIFRRPTYGSAHPLAIPRVSTCIDLCRALGWLPDDVYIDSPRATPEQLARFHDPDYLEALIAAEREGRAEPERRRRYNIGLNGNPIHPLIFSRPATAGGGTLLAARLLAEVRAGGRPGVPSRAPIVYNPAGGTHHGRSDRASGFCYLNDPVLGLLALLDAGPRAGFERLLYLDVDAHHGDGVQDAFADEPRVMTISLHEAGRWPMTPDSARGSAADRGGPRGEGTARNLPVPAGFHDDELAFLLEAAVLPLIERFDPAALMLQCGADALAEDPMSRLALSNRALWSVVAALRGLGLPLIVLGGGGYNPWSVGRCWAGVWATLTGQMVPERLPAEAEAVLRGLSWRHRRGRNPPEAWFTTLADPWRHGPIRPEIRALAAEVLA